MANEARQETKRLLDMIEQGVLDRDAVILMCVNHMSEAEVADMMHNNDLDPEEDDDEDDEEEDALDSDDRDFTDAERDAGTFFSG